MTNNELEALYFANASILSLSDVRCLYEHGKTTPEIILDNTISYTESVLEHIIYLLSKDGSDDFIKNHIKYDNDLGARYIS